MFLRKKIIDLLGSLDQRLCDITEKLSEEKNSGESLPTALKELEASSSAAADKILEEMSKLSEKQNRHDMAIEDMLDIWDEKSAEADKIIASFQTAYEAVLQNEKKQQLDEAKAREQRLLTLAHTYQLQLDQLGQMLDKEDGWARQFQLIIQKTEAVRRQAGISLIGREGEAIDLKAHEVMEIVPTDDPGQQATVARVYETGFIYLGEVYCKAKVAAYRHM